jgi:hypothetical protein
MDFIKLPYMQLATMEDTERITQEPHIIAEFKVYVIALSLEMMAPLQASPL